MLERVGGKVVEICSPSVFILWHSHFIRSGQAPGQGTVQDIVKYATHMLTKLCSAPSNLYLTISEQLLCHTHFSHYNCLPVFAIFIFTTEEGSCVAAKTSVSMKFEQSVRRTIAVYI